MTPKEVIAKALSPWIKPGPNDWGDPQREAAMAVIGALFEANMQIVPQMPTMNMLEVGSRVPQSCSYGHEAQDMKRVWFAMLKEAS